MDKINKVNNEINSILKSMTKHRDMVINNKVNGNFRNGYLMALNHLKEVIELVVKFKI